MAMTGKVRGLLWRANPKGSQTNPTTKQRGDWWVSYCCGLGHRHREKVGPKSLARDEHERVRTRVRRERYCPARERAGRVTVASLLDAVVADYEANGRRAVGEIRRHRDRLVAHFGPTRDAATLTAGDIDAYGERRRRPTAEGHPGAAVATVNRELACLRRGLRLAYRKGRLATIPAVILTAEHNTRTGFFEPAETASLLAASPAPWRTFWNFLHLTGWRTGEARGLTWAQVDFGAGVLRLEPGTTKNREGRTFPFAVLPALATLLRDQREATRVVERQMGQIIPWVFHVAGAQIGKHDIRRAWLQATTAAGLKGKLPHDFRRTAVRNLERAGVPRSVAMKLTGHKTESVYRRYAIVAEADLAEGVAKLANLTLQQAPATVVALRPTAEGASS